MLIANQLLDMDLLSSLPYLERVLYWISYFVLRSSQMSILKQLAFYSVEHRNIICPN